MAHSKPLLIPWLKSSIDSKRYPGVHWTNPEQTEFCIPWKHALRQDSSNEDVLIFKAWAEASGNGPAQGDPSVWKRNFRSALRAKGFKMVSDNKNDAANPHKVYRWPEESASGARIPNSSESQKQEDANVLNGYNPQGVCNDAISECPGSQDILQESEGTTGFQPPTEQQQLQNQLVIGAHPLPGQQQDPVMFEGAARETGLPEQPARPAGGVTAEGAGDGQQAAQFLETVNQTRDGDHFSESMLTCSRKRNKSPLKLFTSLFFRPDLNDPVLDPETGLSIVSLPRPVGILDQTQASLTQRILDNLGSLDVGMSQHVIYGQRCGEVKAYWSFSKFDSSRQPREISKLNPELLYQVKDFIRGLMDFFDGKESPPSSMFFCLGEKWPDPENKPWEKKLIMVEVVPTSMELLKNAAVECGASSLRSVELQMSLEEMMDLY
uniref:IRF tryptophan pentad repeat domain-containing protein n=1 Tax=Xiphophorus couchianus TaxID=32473 RepID=A0A3B5L3P1_9TELE